MREKRQSGRAFIRCQVVVKTLKADGTPLCQACPRYGHTTDFSLHGARVVLAAPLEAGARVEVVIVLLNPPASFRHMGVVRWCRPAAAGQKYFAGFEFKASSPAVRQAWQKILAARFPAAVARPAHHFARDHQSLW